MTIRDLDFGQNLPQPGEIVKKVEWLWNNLMNNESEEAKDSDGKMPVEDDIGNQLGLIGHVV